MHHPGAALLGQLGFVLIVGLYAVRSAVLVEAAPPQVRCTVVALGYNLCVAVFGGGLTPLTATWLVERTGNELSPGLLIMAAATIAFGAALRFRETYCMPLDGVAAQPRSDFR